MDDLPQNGLSAEWQSAQEVAQPDGPKFDHAKYLAQVEDIEMSEEQKIEVLRTLWEIMASFVNLGFGVDSVQLFVPALEYEGDDEKIVAAATDSGEAQGAGKEPEA